MPSKIFTTSRLSRAARDSTILPRPANLHVLDVAEEPLNWEQPRSSLSTPKQ